MGSRPAMFWPVKLKGTAVRTGLAPREVAMSLSGVVFKSGDLATSTAKLGQAR